MKNTWFRLYSSIKSEPKFRRLTNEQKWWTVCLLCCASESADRGVIRLSRTVLCDELGCESAELQTLLTALAERGIISIGTDNAVTVLNWQKHQQSSDDRTEYHREYWHKRQAKKKQAEQAVQAEHESSTADTALTSAPVAVEPVPHSTDTQQQLNVESTLSAKNLERFWENAGAKSDAKPSAELFAPSPTAEPPEPPPKPHKTIPPLRELVELYFNERGHPNEADRFYDYYCSNGWKVGKNPMRDWKAAVRNWINNQKLYGHGNNTNNANSASKRTPSGGIAPPEGKYAGLARVV